MSKQTRGLDGYMTIVEQGNMKTASAKPETFNIDLITKLAEALVEESASATPQVNAVPAAATVMSVSPAVLAADAAVADAQVVAAGGVPAIAAAGEVPAEAKPNVGVVVSDVSGTVTDSNNMHKDPVAVAVAAEGEAEKTSALKQAEEFGAAMARSYVAEIEKIAADRQYEEAKAFLSEKGLLEGYTIK